jgi:hypothetical protein
VHLEHLRRMQRYPHEQLSAVEFDSLEIVLRANSSADLIELQNELRRIIGWLTWRKEAAKPASILLLRFLHCYFPEEIMRIGLLRRHRVDSSLATWLNDGENPIFAVARARSGSGSRSRWKRQSSVRSC